MNPPTTKRATLALIEELRAIVPNRPLTYGESLQGARRQAARLRAKAAVGDEPAINLLWLVQQKAIPVSFVPSYKLGEESGLTTDRVDGQLRMYINSNEPRVRQRFSLLHELKHVLDFESAGTLHAKLGRGNPRRRAEMVEWVANEFAAYVLMPTMFVKRAWFAKQDIRLLAHLFNVSTEAMATRLEKLGLMGEPKPAPRTYFRSTLFPAAGYPLVS